MVDAADVVQGGGLARPVPYLAMKGQGLLQVLQGLLVLPAGVVEIRALMVEIA